jgi:E3 ubiquitin-protein ligase BOI-like protein
MHFLANCVGIGSDKKRLKAMSDSHQALNLRLHLICEMKSSLINWDSLDFMPNVLKRK